MVEPETLTFLAELAANNRKIWLDGNRPARDDALRNFTGMAITLHDYAGRFDPFVAEAKFKPKQSYTKLFQEPRDRVGRGLYRTGIDVFANAGHPTEDFGYYLHIEPGNCHAGAALFEPSKSALARMRARFVEDAAGLDVIFAEAEFSAIFPQGAITRKVLKSAPEGFDASGPAAPYLKMVGLGCRADLSDAQVQDDEVIDRLIEVFRASRPLIRHFS